MAVRRAVERRKHDAEHPFSSASKSKSLHPLAQGRRLRRLRGTTLIRLGRHSRCPMPFIRPVTRARRNPLLGFRGSRLGGEFSKIWVGSHHPPTLCPECWSQPPAPFSHRSKALAARFQHSGVQTVAYYSSSLPLPLLFDDFSFRRGLLTCEFREHNEHAFDRPKQGIPGEHDK